MNFDLNETSISTQRTNRLLGISASNNAGLALTGDSWREYALRRMAQPL